MAVRLIAGRAGSGKTHRCLTRIIEALGESLTEGPRLILLVPEQAGLQMERSLLSRTGTRLLGRCEVLSYRRLSHRILTEVPGRTPAVMTPNGRQMALRYLIGRHQRNLTEFGRVSNRPGFVAAISSTITELLQESTTVEELQGAAARAEAEQHPSSARLHDVALLYRVYLEYLGSDRVDPEGVLDLARARMSTCAWLDGARVWIDGFAGLTQQQLRMIVALGRRASEVELALLLDPSRGESKPEELSLFSRTEQTWARVSGALRESEVAVDPPVWLGDAPRFRQKALLQLERNLFSELPERTAAQDLTGEINSEPSVVGAIRYAVAPDRRAECAASARAVLDLIHSGDSPMRYRDIAIIVRDLEPYHDLLSAELAAHGIPYFIDRRQPTFHHPLIQLLRAALAMRAEARLDQAVSQLLKTGLVDIEEEHADALENYLLAHGIDHVGAWNEPWTYSPPGIDADEESPVMQERLAQLRTVANQLRELVGPWWPTADSRKGRRSCRKWSGELFELTCRLGAERRLSQWIRRAQARGDHDEAAEHAQAWNDLVKLLDEMALVLGDEMMTGRQFQECLESGLSQMTLGLVPSTLDQVLVGSIERSRHPPVRAVLLLGFCEGQFPAHWSEDSILSDEERTWLESGGVSVGRTRQARQLDERMLAYIAMSRASEFLRISRPEADERGRPIEASMYEEALLSAMPELTVERIEPDGASNIGTIGDLCRYLSRGGRRWVSGETDLDWLALYEWSRNTEALSTPVRSALSSLLPARPAAKLSPRQTQSMWRPPYRTSVSALERFAWCPFQHFADRGLDLKPRAHHEIAPVDMGRIYHTVLQQLVNEMIERGMSLADYTSEEIKDSVERLCKAVVPLYAQDVRMDERQRRAAIWRGRQQLPAALHGAKSTAQRTPLRPRKAELAFGLGETDALPALELQLPDGRTVLVRGRIDRLDLMPHGNDALGVVFDYKRTIGKKLNLNEVFHGLALQLLTYLLVLREHGRSEQGGRIIPGGAFYIPLVAGLKRVDGPTAADKAGLDGHVMFRPRGLVDFDALGEMVPGWTQGECPAFSVFRKQDGGIGYPEQSDALEKERWSRVLDFVREKLTALAANWLTGNISVSPARLGCELPCSRCPYRGVCRYEYSARQSRLLSTLGRTEILNRMTNERAS